AARGREAAVSPAGAYLVSALSGSSYAVSSVSTTALPAGTRAWAAMRFRHCYSLLRCWPGFEVRAVFFGIEGYSLFRNQMSEVRSQKSDSCCCASVGTTLYSPSIAPLPFVGCGEVPPGDCAR